MAKLYPPYIDGTLPAFCLDEEGNGEISIPFIYNDAVSEYDVKSLMVKIKTVQNDELLGDVPLGKNGKIKIKNFKLNKTTLIVGQFYKIQLACVDYNGIIGYYSTVGVIKCTAEPEVYIDGFTPKKINNNNHNFLGIYTQNRDMTEKVYSSRFIITDKEKNVIKDTGDILHSYQDDVSANSSQTLMILDEDLNFDTFYYIEYIITTNNGLVYSSPKYILVQQRTTNMSFEGTFSAVMNSDEGYISLQAYSKDGEHVDGTYVIMREDSLYPNDWKELYRFSFGHKVAQGEIFRDFTIEQGKTYIYSLQQYNYSTYVERGVTKHSYVYSNRKLTDSIIADFDDMFLYDGKRQLKLRFNPQVSNFKTQLAESRNETIGSKYPYFYRNAMVGYKVFPYSGLISMLSDDNELFLTYNDILRQRDVVDRHSTNILQDTLGNNKNNTYSNHDGGTVDVSDTEDSNYSNRKDYNQKPHNPLRNLVNNNFTSERLFKINVLDWLNNGKVKLFKSPAEGNYLVRLMDNSLAPNNTIGRMLHTANGTAYEAAELNHANLIKYGILEDSATKEIDNTIKNWKTIDMSTVKFNNGVSNNILPEGVGTTILRFLDYLPGTQIKLVFDSTGDFEKEDSTVITIGTTGDYYANDVRPVYGIYIFQNIKDGKENLTLGNVSYEYDAVVQTSFDILLGIDVDMGAYQQIVGKNDDVIETYTNIKEEPVNLYMAKAYKRPVEFLYNKNNRFALDTGITSIFNDSLDDDGYRVTNGITDNLYWDLFFNKNFNDKDSLEYSPFCLYVIKDMYIDEENILDHMPQQTSDTTTKTWRHTDNHLFEQYYTERILNAVSAEEMLSNYCALYNSMSEEEWAQENPLYILDAWEGKIYKVGDFFDYKPEISIDENIISLKEIGLYEIENVDLSKDFNLSFGNGVYGEIFYQNNTKTYSFELNDETVAGSKNVYELAYKDILDFKKNTNNIGFDYDKTLQQKVDNVNSAYADFIDILQKTHDDWFAKEE